MPGGTEVQKALKADMPAEASVLSAGNSSGLSHWCSGGWQRLSYPAHLRVGESILLGWDIMTKEPLPGLRQDAFPFYAKLVGLPKAQPSSGNFDWLQRL